MTGENFATPAVLVIDDEGLIRWSIGECLSEHGYCVRLAASGGEGRRAVEASAGQDLVVVLDLHLPDVDDLELLRDIHTARPEAPIIVMSTSEHDEARCRMASPGVTAFLRKPFDLTVLASLVREAWPARDRLR